MDVSTPQRPKLHLNVSRLQGYVLLLRLSIYNHGERTIEIGIDPWEKVMSARLWPLPILNIPPRPETHGKGVKYMQGEMV